MEHFDSQPCDKHLVFRNGASWFSLPALAVREVTFRPKIVPVPNSHRVLAGLCHIRNEFLPVLSLRALFSEDISSANVEAQLIVVGNSDAPWAILVDEVLALESLETTVSTGVEFDEDGGVPVESWATYQDQSIRVLDPAALYEFAQNVLETAWFDEEAAENRNEKADESLHGNKLQATTT